MIRFLRACLHGIAQVFFQANAVAGGVFLAAMAYAAHDAGDWSPMIGAVLGILVATLTARLLDLDEAAIDQGLYGFNGVLIGAALPTFIAASPQLWAYVVVGAAASTVFTATFSATLTRVFGVPGSTGPFVLAGWLMVAGAYSFGGLDVIGESPRLPSVVTQHALTIPRGMELVEIFFRNIGQVFLLGSWVSGAMVLAGVMIASVPAGIAVIAGSAIAMIVSIGLAADPSLVRQGLYGFSPVLTAVAVGVVFLKPSLRVALYAGLATVVTVFVQGALDVIVAPAGVPSFTAPYVLTMVLFVAPRRLMVPHPHRPVAGHAVGTTPPGG